VKHATVFLRLCFKEQKAGRAPLWYAGAVREWLASKPNSKLMCSLRSSLLSTSQFRGCGRYGGQGHCQLSLW